MSTYKVLVTNMHKQPIKYTAERMLLKWYAIEVWNDVFHSEVHSTFTEWQYYLANHTVASKTDLSLIPIMKSYWFNHR